MIYGIRDDSKKLMKVGFSTNDNERLSRLQTGNGERLKLIGTCIGVRLDESALHRILHSRRVHGEWFDDSDGAITRLIEALASCSPSEKAPTSIAPLPDQSGSKNQRDGSLVTVKHLAQKYPAFSEASIRWLLFQSHSNGLDKFGAIVKLGRRVLIDEDAFFRFVRSGVAKR